MAVTLRCATVVEYLAVLKQVKELGKDAEKVRVQFYKIEDDDDCSNTTKT